MSAEVDAVFARVRSALPGASIIDRAALVCMLDDLMTIARDTEPMPVIPAARVEPIGYLLTCDSRGDVELDRGEAYVTDDEGG